MKHILQLAILIGLTAASIVPAQAQTAAQTRDTLKVSILGDSFSGATICFTGYKDKSGNFRDYSDRSFVGRASDLGDPDIIAAGCRRDGAAKTSTTSSRPSDRR